MGGSRWHGRHEARRELDIAERVLDRTNAIVERTRQRSAPDVELYHAAVANLEDTRTDLRHHDLATQIDSASRRLPELKRAVAALDTWQRWANGETISFDRLRATVADLTGAHRSEHSEKHCALGHVLQAWAGTTGIDLHPADRQPPALQHTGIELGL